MVKLKKTLKITLTILCLVGIAFEIYELCVNYSDDGLGYLIFSTFFFLSHLFIWIAPKTFFNICWKLSRFYPDEFDYDTSFSKIGNVGLGLLITAIIILCISVLLTVL